jgi:transcriptional regulator with XRE-family HTH domain
MAASLEKSDLRSFAEEVGRRLSRHRRSRGLSQAQLGKLSGHSLQQIHKYEIGASAVRASSLWMLARALHVDVSDLYPRKVDAAADGPVQRSSADKG